MLRPRHPGFDDFIASIHAAFKADLPARWQGAVFNKDVPVVSWWTAHWPGEDIDAYLADPASVSDSVDAMRRVAKHLLADLGEAEYCESPMIHADFTWEADRGQWFFKAMAQLGAQRRP